MGWQGMPLSSLGLSPIKACDASGLEALQSAKPGRDILPTTMWKDLRHCKLSYPPPAFPPGPQGHLTPLDGEFSSCLTSGWKILQDPGCC